MTATWNQRRAFHGLHLPRKTLLDIRLDRADPGYANGRTPAWVMKIRGRDSRGWLVMTRRRLVLVDYICKRAEPILVDMRKAVK